MTTKPKIGEPVVYTSGEKSKEVLRNGMHFADVIDEEAADEVAHALNMLEGLRRLHVRSIDLGAAYIPTKEVEEVEETEEVE